MTTPQSTDRKEMLAYESKAYRESFAAFGAILEATEERDSHSWFAIARQYDVLSQKAKCVAKTKLAIEEAASGRIH